MQTDNKTNKEKKRDYKHENELRKGKEKSIRCVLKPQLYDDFTAKCELNGETKNGLIKKWIEKYTYSDEN